MIQKLREEPDKYFIEEINVLMRLRDGFAKEREIYLAEQENKLNNLLYEKLTIEEIRNMYKRV